MKKINCILLVDDNHADNEFHKIVINKAGVCDHIEIALNGQKALDYINRSAQSPELLPQPELIFLDVNMPRMNGFEFLEEYDKLDEELKSKLVVMMLTTSLNPVDRERANEYDCLAEFLNKPLTSQSVQKLVEKYF
jgi:CheY-like chemotaxis protein